mgnify:CR=1 FL=1
MAKGHKKIAGTYCYGCTNRFCEFCCKGDKYEEIKAKYYDYSKESKRGLDEMIEERLDSLIDKYTEKIENDTELIRMYRDELKSVFEETDGLSIPKNARIARSQGVIERTALQVYLEKAFLNDLKQLKGEQVKD